MGEVGRIDAFSSKSEAGKILQICSVKSFCSTFSSDKIELVTELRWLARFDPAGSTSKLLVVSQTLEREWGAEGHIEVGPTFPLPARRMLASSTSSMSWRG
jgi:hypothetical protein